MKKLPTFQDQVHFMSRQAELLDEQGHDVSANVMRDCMNVLVAEHARSERLALALRELYRQHPDVRAAVTEALHV
jgi:hypothetical protein